MRADQPAPQPGAALLESARLQLRVDRGEIVPFAELAELARWGEIDTLVAAYVMYPAGELLGVSPDRDALLDLIDRIIELISASWSPGFQGILRIAAVVCGQAADLAPRAAEPTRSRLLQLADAYAARADARLALPASTSSPAPGAESLAWAARLAAERLRLARVVGSGVDGEPVGREELVAAWEAAVAAYERYGHVPETIRARARLAEALALVGRGSDANQVAARARADAELLGLTPALTILDAVLAPERGAGSAAGEHHLTAREREVLDLVALGRTNGQIGRELFITTKTVSVHVSNVLAKLGAANRAEAAAIARRQGLLD